MSNAEIDLMISMLEHATEPLHVLFSDEQILEMFRKDITDMAKAEANASKTIETCESLRENHTQEIRHYFCNNLDLIEQFYGKLERVVRLAKLTLVAAAN